jgi:hypothetical protein
MHACPELLPELLAESLAELLPLGCWVLDWTPVTDACLSRIGFWIAHLSPMHACPRLVSGLGSGS